MTKQSILLSLIVIANTTFLSAFVDIEQELYDPAAEMKMLDDAMNKGIEQQREKNLRTPMVVFENDTFDTDEALEFVFDNDQYVLEKTFEDINNTEVKTKLENRILSVTEIKKMEQVTIDEAVTLGSTAMTTKQYFESTTTETLSIPPEANEKTFTSRYEKGVLKVTFQKK